METDVSTIQVAIQGAVGWLLTMLMRKLSPEFWDKINARWKKLAIVAISVLLSSTVSSLIAGDLWSVAIQKGLAAFLVAIGMREVSKKKPPIAGLSGRRHSIRTTL